MHVPPPLETFGERIAYWRRLRGFKRQGELASRLGITQSSLSLLESGDSKAPAADTLLKLCDELRLRPKYVLFGEGPPEAQHFQELNGLEAQLVMIFRQLPSDALREALLIDANNMLERSRQAAETPDQVYERLRAKPPAKKAGLGRRAA